MKIVKILTLFSFLFSFNSFAQNEWLENVDIYLHTVERGQLVYDNFGHTAIRVHNRLNGSDMVYNWGIFDFTDPVEFSLKFYRGILIYKLGVYPYESALAYYQKEQRTVWEDKINFSNDEKLIFLKRLEWNYLPENRDYSYHYFFDNCSTRVRDYFDEALSGSIKKHFEELSSNRTFRDTVQEGYNTNPEIYLSLDILMNGNIDKEMNKWQEMFLPAYLRTHLKNKEDGKPFFSESKILFEFPAPKKTFLNGFQIYSSILFVLIASLFAASIKRFKKVEKTLWAITFMPIFIWAVFGITMIANWIFSGHIDLHHNLNIALIWPSDFLLLWPVIMIIFKGESWQSGEKSQNLWSKYISAHLIMNGIFILLGLMGIFEQDISNPALYLATSFSAFLLFVKKYIVKTEVPKMGYGID